MAGEEVFARREGGDNRDQDEIFLDERLPGSGLTCRVNLDKCHRPGATWLLEDRQSLLAESGQYRASGSRMLPSLVCSLSETVERCAACRIA